MPCHEATFAALLFSLSLALQGVEGGKILIVPFEGSHWLNMNIMIKALHARGHAIDVVRSNKSWFIKDNSPHYKTITVPVVEAFNHDFINPILKNIFAIERGENPAVNFVSLQLQMFSALSELHRITCDMTVIMLKDKKMMDTLRARSYDLVLTDPAWGAGVLLAQALKLPVVFNVRWITSGEGHLAIAPSPLSYIPIIGSGLTDKMTFMQRLKNVFFYLMWQTQDTFLIHPQYQAVCDQLLDGVSYSHLLRGADLWLMRVDYVFEFPRPTMPNVIYIGGFHIRPHKALSADLEEFLQSSGDHGFIIMSLGSMVGELPSVITNEIAAAFAKLLLKVIWKYKGERPTTLGNNTLLVDWMPQNDLLGHPKVKLFVAHGGTNGLQEAIYHGVPVVGLPVFFDQYDNLLRLKDRGAAKILSLATVDKDDNFLKAIEEVLSEPSYRENMQRLSRLQRDQPIAPLDNALFWIEFVMRHKGAAHLKAESYRMPWYSYHSVDVVLFLTGAVLLLLFTAVVFIRCLCSTLCKRKVKRD